MSAFVRSPPLLQLPLAFQPSRLRSMSFFKCCVGADPRPPPEAIRPVHASNRRNAGNDIPNGAAAGKKKTKMPTEVFFDPTKPDGQLSSITDPPNSTRENPDSKKKKETKERSGRFAFLHSLRSHACLSFASYHASTVSLIAKQGLTCFFCCEHAYTTLSTYSPFSPTTRSPEI